jgi:VWFA-related protein
VLALDASGSMRKSADALMSAARTFVDALRPEDKLSLLFFSDGVLVAHGLGTNRQTSIDAINSYKPVGGTALYDGLADAFGTLKTVEGRRAVVVMTDGRDENNPGTAPGSSHTLPQVLELAREVDATVLPIGLGTNVDRSGLEHLADISGGIAYFPSDASELHSQFARTMENLRRRYVLGYTSTHIQRDGSWRNVEIKSRSANHVIRSRSGYFAPDK